MNITKIICVLVLISMCFIQPISAREIVVPINMSLKIDAYKDSNEVITRTAKLIYPNGAFPTGPFSMSDACTSPYSQDFPIQFYISIEAPVNASTWDLGENITRILNMTSYVYNYTVGREVWLSSLRDINLDLSKDLSYCRNTTANAVNTGEYQLCIQQKSQFMSEKQTCEVKLKSAEDSKIMNILIGAGAASIIILMAKKKYYQAPAEREFPK